ncbi:SARP family transcriptional regulator [Actinomycetota bacterium]|nr:SARP family transcriptional regulator [Actinomycetota bacterium]
MLLSILGPVAVDGRPVPGERLPTLVRALAESPGQSVSTSALVEEVWADEPPDHAVGAVQALVSRARRLGLDIQPVAGGYRLVPDEVEVDAVAVVQHLRAARTALRAGQCSEARAETRAAHALLVVSPRTLLASPLGAVARLGAELVTLDVQTALAAGEVPDDLGPLRALALGSPPDEPAVALLVRALAAQGRESQALEVLDQLRHELAERYGTDPSPVVADVHLALLRGELSASPEQLSPVPATTTADAMATALPAPWRRSPTALLGREAELLAVEAALADHPLVTVVAVGGAGKTRLAAEIARRATAAGTDVHVLELAGLQDPAEVLPALLVTLGATETEIDSERPNTRRALPTQLRLRRAVSTLSGLLVLDNCEHLIAVVADLVAQIIDAGQPGLRVLATSRAPLGILGEAVHPLQALSDETAVALLGARARAARPVLGWDDATALTLCHHLDNLPLALELAGARLRSMSLDDVLAAVTDRFGLLDHALRGLPARHEGLWAMVDWSWTLLGDLPRRLAAEVAVFPVPFTAEAAAAVTRREASGTNGTAGAPGEVGVDEVRRALAVLVEQSLLTLQDDGSSPTRYRMLETVREYGEARLRTDGERAEVLDRLTDWAAAECRALRTRLVGPPQVPALRLIDAETETFLVALRWALEHHRQPQVVAVAAVLLCSWTVRGLHVEAASWARQVMRTDEPAVRRRLAAAGPTGGADPDDAAMVAMIAMINSGVAGDLRTAGLALRSGRRVLRDAEQLDGRLAALLRATGTITSNDPDTQLAEAALLAAHPDPYVRALGLFFHAAARENLGEMPYSLDEAYESYALFQTLGDEWGMAIAAQGIGQWEAGQGSDGAEHWLEVAERHLLTVGALPDARAMAVARQVHRALRGSTEARAALDDAVAATGSDALVRAQAAVGLAAVAADEGQWDRAVALADQAVAIAATHPQSIDQASLMYALCAAVLRARAGLDAGPALRALVPRVVATHDVPILGSLALGFAEHAAATGDRDRSRALWALARRLGANLSLVFGPGLATALFTADMVGDADEQAALLAQVADLSIADATARLLEMLGT